MTREVQIREAVRKALGGVLNEQIEAALAPHMKQDTEWFDRLIEQNRINDENKIEVDEAKKGFGAARYARAMAWAHRNQAGPDGVKWYMRQMIDSNGKGHGAWNDALGRTMYQQVDKVLQAGDFDAGGFLVPPQFANEVIEFLRARSVVRGTNPRTLPMPSGSITIPRQTGTTSGQYEGESGAGSTVGPDPTGGTLTLSSKKLKGIVPVSNDLLQFAAGDAADAFVRDDLVAAIGTREDQAFLRDDGTQRKPKGLRFFAKNTKGQSGTTLSAVQTDTADILGFIEDANVPMERMWWFMAPRSKRFLQFELTDADGRALFRDEVNAGQFMGMPIATTTNIPTNLGGGGNESEIILADMAQAIIAEVQDLVIAVATEAAYTDPGTGNVVSAFERDETLMRAITKHDFAVRHDEAVAVLTGVTWGV